MNCALNIEQQRALFRKVYGDLNDLKSSGQTFMVKDYIQSIYNLIYTKTNDHAMALDYARLVPHYIMRSMIKDEDLMDHLLNNGFDLGAINSLKRKFTQQIENVETYIGNSNEALKELKELQKQVIENGSKLEPNPLKAVGTQPRNGMQFKAIPPTALADRGQEALSMKEGDPNFNVPNPDVAFYYKVKRKLIEMISEPSADFDSRNVVIPNFGKVFLTIMSSSKIPVDQLYPGTPINSDAHKQGLSMVVTDEYGTPVMFDNDLNLDLQNGRMAYYHIRKTDGLVKDGQVTLQQEDYNSADALVRQLGITKEDAIAVIKEQIKFINDLREYINKDTENNTIKAHINGGSMGYALNDYVKIKNSISSINFDNDTFDPFQAKETNIQKGLTTGYTYFYTKGMMDTPIEVKLGELTPELKETLTTLFADSLYEKDLDGNVYALSSPDRQAFIDNYIKTGPDTIQLAANNDNKTYAVIIKGEKIDMSDPITARQKIQDYFEGVSYNKSVAANRVPSGAIIINANDPALITKARPGNYVEAIVDGKTKFYLVEGRKIHINNSSLNRDFDNASFEKNAEGATFVVRNIKPYNDFIKENSHIDYQLNGQNKLLKLNAYITYAPLDEEMNKIYAPNEEVSKAETKAPVNTLTTNKGPADNTSIDDLLRKTFEDPEFNKLIDQADKGLKATQEQIEEAKIWYENHPLSKYFPFHTLFNVINTRTPNGIASWTMDGINLFKGSDYSDLYHESWHGFSQAFLTIKERTDLYNEARKISGTFVDYLGNTVKFSDANELQIEEFLAESFREYMLKGKSIKGLPIRNSIFRKILNFLKALFGNSSVIDIANNDKAIKTIHELYEKLRVGNLNEMSFNVENRSFDILHKGMVATNKEEEQKTLSNADSTMMLDTIDSLISEYVDRANMGLLDAEKIRAAELSEKLKSGKATIEEREELKGLQSRQTYKFTATLLKSANGLKSSYKYAQMRLAGIRNTMVEQTKVANEQQKARIQKNIDLLDYVLRNFGDVEMLSENKLGEGMIGYHRLKSKYISEDEREAFKEDNLNNENEEDKYLKGKEGYDRGGNENSLEDQASTEVLYMVRSLHKTDLNGNISYNRLGIPELAGFDPVWRRLARILQNTLNIEDMYQKLLIESNTFPPAKQLLNKLGPVRTQSSSQFAMWTNFWQAFNKTRIPLSQLTLEKTSIDENGNKVNPSYTVRIGEASADYKKVGQKWENYFKTSYDNPYIKTDSMGANFLDIKKVLADFPQNTLDGKEFEFFNAIGMRLSDKDEIHDAIRKQSIGKARSIRSALYTIQQRGDIVVNSVSAIVKEYPAVYIDDIQFPKIPGEGRNYNKLQELEARYSDDFSNFMVTNAEGNAQFEHSLNNSLTVVVNTINKVKSYDELMQINYMSHLDITRNPFAKASIWLNSIFDMNKPGRPKRRQSDDPKSDFVTVNLQNLSGVAMLENGTSTGDGIASAKADEFTKMILDFHLVVVNGTPELMRHADKGTSFSLWLSNVNTKSEAKRLYIDTASFIPVNGRVPGFAEAFQLLVPHMGAELERIKEMHRLTLQGVTNFDFNYLERGKKFVVFNDVLSPKTKEKLINLPQPLSEYMRGGSLEDNNLISEMFSDFSEYFNKQVSNVDTQLSSAKFVADSLITQVKSEAFKKGIKGVNEANAYKAAVGSFVFNSWIHNIESLAIIYGDLAQYNMLKEEFHKRNAGMASTGDIFRTDQAAIDYINNVLTSEYAKSMNIPTTTFDGTFTTAVVEDNEIGSKYYEEYLEALGDKDAVKAYAEGNMTEGDGQGWITFDSYRRMLNLEGKWSNKQEALYQAIVKGEVIEDTKIKEFFPTKKVQYFGPMDTKTGLPVTAFHKFSLFPLIPNVIKGTNLENVHNKLMREGFDYKLFKSGSKIGTITKSGLLDKFYSDNKSRTLSDEPYTKNIIFLEFLKDQLEIAPKFKGKVIFSTQLRKLIEDGLMEGGVPTDYGIGKDVTSRMVEWSRLSESKKLETSPRYKLMKVYENNVKTLTETRKKELLKEAGWKMEDGKPVGSVEKLLAFVSKELKRQDLADHELDFLQVGSDGQLKHDLSMSLSADKIERLLNALVTKKLVKQKVNGEGLIQVSGAGFEKMDAYTNPSEKDLSKWGTNDLPTYHRGLDGKTTAMKVKIAMQGQFEKLLELDDVKKHAYKNKITPVEALNLLLKDNDWLNRDDNRRMITMVAVRIPVQGLNSMEFIEVYEFLPKAAGNIIVSPSEIVAKSGSDFDIDKLTVMMPTFRLMDGKMEVAKQYSRSQIEDLYAKTKEAKLRKGLLRDSEGKVINIDSKKVTRNESGELTASELDLSPYNRLLEAIFGIKMDQLDEELINEILAEENMPTFAEFTDKINGSKSVENDLIWNIRQILELPENFINFIRPNDTDIVKPLADELKDQVADYNAKDRVFPNKEEENVISGTKCLEILYNLYKHTSNNIGKQTLGLGAVDNTYNVVFNRIGAYMNAKFMSGKGKSKFEKRLTLMMPHNTIDIGEDKVISLSHMYDAGEKGKNKISDVISQLMNGWVDIAKDAWIFNLQGNKEVAPSLLFMIQAGIPFKTAVYLVSQPLVREYIKQQKLAKSTFAEPLGKSAANPAFFRSKAREVILENPRYGFNLVASQMKQGTFERALYAKTVDLTTANPQAFEQDALKKVIADYSTVTKAGQIHQTSENERATFLHYLEIESMSGAIRDVKMRMNFDTSKSSTLFDAQNRQLMVEQLRNDGRLPESIVDNILENSPIGSFYIQPFQLEIWKDFFKLRNHPALNNYLMSKFQSRNQEDVNSTFGDPEKFANEFRNDFMSFVFQNEVRKFNLETDSYKGMTIGTELPVKSVASLVFGAIVKDDVMYVDKDQLKKDFINGTYATQNYVSRGLATIPVNAFAYSRDYYKFVFEREYLRALYPIDKLTQSEDFIDKYEHNVTNRKNMKEGESEQNFVKRMKGITYEEMLRDMALDNTFNGWKMFRSKNTYADQFLRIREKYPELDERYSILKTLSISFNKSGYKNLRLNDNMLDADKINVFNENLEDLANPTVKKVEDALENERISQFFSKFSTYAFLQSGLNTKSSFSLVRLVPQDKFIRMMEEPVKDYTDNLNPVTMQKYYDRFMSVNNVMNRSNRIRYKDYAIDKIDLQKDKTGTVVTEAKLDEASTLSPEAYLFSEDYSGNTLYDAEDLNMVTAKKLVTNNPGITFVYNAATVSSANPVKFDFSIHSTTENNSNSFGIPTRKNYGNLHNSFSDISTEAGVNMIDPKNKEIIDFAISELIALKNDGHKLAFSKAGYGQYMLGANDSDGLNPDISKAKAPKTFLYLSEQLFRHFGYKNPNYSNTGTGRKVIQSTQEVSDEMVKDMLNHCFNYL